MSQSGAAPKNSKVIDSRSKGGGAGAGRRNVSAAGGGAKKGAPQSKKDKVREEQLHNIRYEIMAVDCNVPMKCYIYSGLHVLIAP